MAEDNGYTEITKRKFRLTEASSADIVLHECPGNILKLEVYYSNDVTGMVKEVFERVLLNELSRNGFDRMTGSNSVYYLTHKSSETESALQV